MGERRESELDAQRLAEDWARRGFSCDLWTDPPGQRWEGFVHDTDEIVSVVVGELEFEIEGRVHHPAPGEELFIPAGARHSARNVGRSTARWFYGYRCTGDREAKPRRTTGSVAPPDGPTRRSARRSGS